MPSFSLNPFNSNNTGSHEAGFDVSHTLQERRYTFRLAHYNAHMAVEPPAPRAQTPVAQPVERPAAAPENVSRVTHVVDTVAQRDSTYAARQNVEEAFNESAA